MLRLFVPTRFLAAAALVTGLALAGPSYAQAVNSPAAPAAQPAKHMAHDPSAMKEFSPEAMEQHVEKRISTLHDKLKITQDQESEWSSVAQAMRDNESTFSNLIQERRKNAESRTAIEDLNSYQQVAQAHADGIKRVADAFAPLYDKMSGEQKKNADQVFGRFEGHRGMGPHAGHMMGDKHHHMMMSSGEGHIRWNTGYRNMNSSVYGGSATAYPNPVADSAYPNSQAKELSAADRKILFGCNR